MTKTQQQITKIRQFGEKLSMKCWFMGKRKAHVNVHLNNNGPSVNVLNTQLTRGRGYFPKEIANAE